MNLSENHLNQIKYNAMVLKDLHSVWTPHAGQIPIGKSLFIDGIKDNILECGRKFGKALEVATPILTTHGWSTMGKLNIGDYVFSPEGTPIMVIYKSSPQMIESYDIKFSTGETITACKDHEWKIRGEIVTTSQLSSGDTIPLCEPFDQLGAFNATQLMSVLSKFSIGGGKYSPPKELRQSIGTIIPSMGKSFKYENGQFTVYSDNHVVESVTPVGLKNVQCIGVDSEDHLFLCGNSLITTHNTDFLCYALWRWALTHPNSYNYYFAPLRDQIMDLVWANGRLPQFLPPDIAKKYVKSINNTDKRIVLYNGAFIKCDGSDNHEKARGYSATGLSAYDETKDFHKEFHIGYNPNRAINDSPLLAVGTPGDGNDLLSDLWDFADLKDNVRGKAFRMPTSMNPHISEKFLIEERMKAVMKDELDKYLIEYEAQRIKLGSKFIFSMLNKSHMIPYDKTLEIVKNNRKDYDFFIAADPGSAKVFAVVFGAIHRHDKHIIMLNEIYEPKLAENSVKKMAPRILQIVDEINPNYDDWMACYDHAATWFYSELLASYEDFPIDFVKCEKDTNSKEDKLSLIKDGLISNTLKFTDKCVKLFWEMQLYHNKDGKVVKKDDHAIDAMRYLYNLAGYTSIEEAVPMSFEDKYPSGTPEVDFYREGGDDGFRDIDSWTGDY